MIELAVTGACGKMGTRIIQLADADPRFKVVAAVESSDHPHLGRDAGTAAGAGELGVVLSDRIDVPFDMLIDFSHPEATGCWLKRCIDQGARAVIGTTGHSDEQMAGITEAARSIAVLKAPNMSVGMNLLFRLVGQVAQALGEEYDIEIVEAHHRYKKDAPSGTAYGLLQSILDATGRSREVVVHGRAGTKLERPAQQIGMHALRIGDSVGEHAVLFGTMGETVILKHEAHTRDTFVRGALRAAEWLTEKPPGLYSMQDVLFA